MRITKNIFESLRNEGVFGSISFDHIMHTCVYSKKDKSLAVWAAECAPAYWDYGYLLFEGQDNRTEKQAGEGGGWFDTPEDAVLYALGAMRVGRDTQDEETLAIDGHIERISQPKLF